MNGIICGTIFIPKPMGIVKDEHYQNWSNGIRNNRINYLLEKGIIQSSDEYNDNDWQSLKNKGYV